MPQNSKKDTDKGLHQVSDEELKKILEEHKKWLESKDEEPHQGKQADLSFTDLQERDLIGANLREAKLHNADFQMANQTDGPEGKMV